MDRIKRISAFATLVNPIVKLLHQLLWTALLIASALPSNELVPQSKSSVVVPMFTNLANVHG